MASTEGNGLEQFKDTWVPGVPWEISSVEEKLWKLPNTSPVLGSSTVTLTFWGQVERLRKVQAVWFSPS